MKRLSTLLAVLVALTAPALAADAPVVLTLDGRPVDKHGGIAVLRHGIVYADLVDLVKSFNGLITFGSGHSARVSVGPNVATFAPGATRAPYNNTTIVLPGAPFMRNGDLYVPLASFVTLARAKMKVDAARKHADILVNANPLS